MSTIELFLCMWLLIFVSVWLLSDSYPIRPCCAATWSFGALAVNRAKSMLLAPVSPSSAVDAVEAGINIVERDTADQYFVGVGGYPNADGIMELDAAIMDHHARYGAVMGLTNIATPISVARTVMEQCPHNVLIGSGALHWAKAQGFREETILLDHIRDEWKEWQASHSLTVTKRDPSCEDAHDTIGVICLDARGRLAAGTSTSG
jgi:N4-(beta-N-acetylglucosaminyl)-L-asparaginase